MPVVTGSRQGFSTYSQNVISNVSPASATELQCI